MDCWCSRFRVRIGYLGVRNAHKTILGAFAALRGGCLFRCRVNNFCNAHLNMALLLASLWKNCRKTPLKQTLRENLQFQSAINRNLQHDLHTRLLRWARVNCI